MTTSTWTSTTDTARAERRGIGALDILIVALAGAPVASLLAWVFGLGRFSVWFWRMSAPAMVVLGAVAWSVVRRAPTSRLHTALVAGTIGGLLGTAGYDLFRLPFAFAGYRLLAPIDSYGVLLLGAESSSALTGFAGWAFHVSNGVGFGIAYAVVALGRPWWWAVLWAMVLESATVLTPFVDTYALRGKWGLIGIAYAAHVFYGVPLGRWVERASERVAQLREDTTRRPAVLALGATAFGLLVWHHPWTAVVDGTSSSSATVTVRDGRFVPRWLHVPVDGCSTVRNTDDAAYVLRGLPGAIDVPRRGEARVCFPEPGVHRIRTSGKPDAGGFVIVDEELS